MRRYSSLLRKVYKDENKARQKHEHKLNHTKKLKKLFFNFRRRAATNFRNKYSNPYMIKTIASEDRLSIKPENIPTYFGYYKIIKLCNKVPCHLYTQYKENTIYSSNLIEYIPKFYTLYESELLIKYSAYSICIFLSNLFPLGKEFENYLSFYKIKINTINKQNLKKALGFKKQERKVINPFILLNLKPPVPPNFLNSIDFDKSSLDSSDEENENGNKKKKNKNKRQSDSIASIEHLTVKIKKIEHRKRLEESRKKLLMIDAGKKREKELIEEFKNARPNKKYVRMRTLKIPKRHLISLETKRMENEEEEKEEEEEEEEINHFKFKRTFDFITSIKEKEKYEHSKTEIIKDCIKLMSHPKKRIYKINYPQKIMEGHYKTISQDVIGINDICDDEKRLFSNAKTNLLLTKVKKRKDFEENKMRKSLGIDSLITCPNIYSDNPYKNNHNSLSYRSKFRLRKNFKTIF